MLQFFKRWLPSGSKPAKASGEVLDALRDWAERRELQVRPVRDDGGKYAELLTAAGVSVTLSNEPTMIHGYISLALVSPVAAEAFDRGLAALNRALDLRRLEQGSVGVHGDLQFAARGLLDVGGELHQVLGVEIARRIGRGQIPGGLGGGGCAKRQRSRCEQGMDQFHR
jgi:hypothetical protein